MDWKDEKQTKAYRRTYYLANREKIRRRNEAWRKANPDKKRTHDKQYRKVHRESLHIKGKLYWKRNPEKAREISRKHQALKRTTQIEPINEKIVYLRDGWTCQPCKKRVDKRFKFPSPMSGSLDHIVPLSEGGSHTYNNVQLAHFICNISKQAKTLPQGEQLRMF